MAPVARFKVDLSGFSGGPGVNTWFVADVTGGETPDQATVDGTAAALSAFYTTIAGFLQGDLFWTVDPSVAIVEATDGEVQSVLTVGTGPFSGQGTNVTPSAHFLMFKTQLRTGQFEDGRELRGGPFIGPIASNVLQADGNVVPANISTMNTALSDLAAAINTAGGLLVVYRRPRAASGTLPARAGSLAAVTSATIWSKPAVLRSRRD